MKKVLANTFGQFRWLSPPWLSYLKSNPFIGILVLLGFILALAAGLYTYYWYQHLPQRQWISAVISAPKSSGVTETEIIPNPLSLQFGKKKDNIFTPTS